jgi:hypothetical protein
VLLRCKLFTQLVLCSRIIASRRYNHYIHQYCVVTVYCVTVCLVTVRPRAATCQEALWCHAVSPVFFGYSCSNHTSATTTATSVTPAIVAADSTALSVITSSENSSTAAGTATAVTASSSGVDSWKLTAEDRLEVR